MGRDTLSTTSARFQSNVVKAITGYYRLKDFIHTVRSFKTLAEERRFVACESAAIRTSFKEDISSGQHYHAVAKLLFIYMMGYPAHFGQVESLKMVASARLVEKRLGYLGSTQLLDEQQPTLTLITNSIKSDLNSPIQIVVSLALSNLAASASPDISRDLVDEVERLLQSASPYIKQKAAFCAARMVSRASELAEHFEGLVQGLLGDRNHAVVLGGISIAHQLCLLDFEGVPRLRKQLIPPLIRQLKSIISGGYSAEYDVGGVCDPFFQVRILRMMKLLAQGDVATSEEISDVLTQIATSTDSSKNVGHSVLYETAVTIMSIESDQALRNMAINILGRLLSSHSTDNNLRYVALTLLNKIITAGQEGLSAVQRHRATILECLHDEEISIRRRSVELALALISKETICLIMPELLKILETLHDMDDFEFKQSIVTRLSVASAHFAPSPKWYVDTMISILLQIDDAASLSFGGRVVVAEETIVGRREEIVSTFIRLINGTKELHCYATEELYKRATGWSRENEYCRDGKTTEALIQATVWTVGEFGTVLRSGRAGIEEQLIALLSEWALPSSGYSESLIGYVIAALGKLASRLSPPNVGKVRGVLDRIAGEYVNKHNLHYRALEMKSIVSNSALCSILMSRKEPGLGEDQLGRIAATSRPALSRLPSAIFHDKNRSTSPSLLGTPRMSPVPDIFAELAALSLNEGEAEGSLQFRSASTFDLKTSSTSTIDAVAAAANKQDDDQSLGHFAFERGGFRVYFNMEALQGEDLGKADRGTIPESEPGHGSERETSVDIRVQMVNGGRETIEEVQLQCAVPKSLKVRLEAASANRAAPGDTIHQLLVVGGKSGEAVSRSSIRLRVKLSYRWFSSPASEVETHTFDVSRFEGPAEK